MLTRRETLSLMGIASLQACGGGLHQSGTVDFLKPIRGGRTLSSIAEARGAKPGDVVLVRDMARLARPDVWSIEPKRGKWQLQPYQLTDGQAGSLLIVNDWAKFEGPRAVPPEFEINLNLPGWYGIWIGIPRLDLRPVTYYPLDGVDVSLDGEPGFTPIVAERGNRRMKLMGRMNVEIMCFWKCACLDERNLRL